MGLKARTTHSLLILLNWKLLPYIFCTPLHNHNSLAYKVYHMSPTQYTSVDIKTQRWISQIFLTFGVLISIYSSQKLYQAPNNTEFTLGLALIPVSIMLLGVSIFLHQQAQTWSIEETSQKELLRKIEEKE